MKEKWKIKKLPSKGTKKSGEDLKSKNDLKIQVNKLKTTFKDLLIKQSNLKAKEDAINEGNLKIKVIEYKIRAIEAKKETLKPHEYEKELRKLNEEINKNINELSHKKLIGKKDLQINPNNQYIHCDICKEYYHNLFDCWFSSATRCKIYPWFRMIVKNADTVKKYINKRIIILYFLMLKYKKIQMNNITI